MANKNDITSLLARINEEVATTQPSKSNSRASIDRNVVEFDYALEIYNEAMNIENFTPKTIKENLKRVKYFFNWCKERGVLDLTSVSPEIVSKYILYYKNERKAKAQTINKCLNCIRGLYKRCRERKLELDYDSMNVMKKMKEDRPIIQPYTESDVEIILNYPNKNTYTGYRMYFLFVMALDTGMRIQEMLNLKYKNIDTNNRQIIIEYAKSRKSRIVPFSNKLLLEMERFDKLKQGLGIQNEYIFVDLNASRMSYEAVKCYLSRMNKQVKLSFGNNVHMHNFRHTFCYFFIKRGGSMATLQKIAGHASLNTTLQYVNLATSDLSESHDRFSFFNSF